MKENQTANSCLPLHFIQNHCFIELDNNFWLLDTGAQISYFQHDQITKYPPAGSIDDFYHGFGQFKTDIYDIPIALNESRVFTIKCGKLPDLLATSLLMGSVSGIIGNEILKDRVVGYFPRRKIMLI